MAALGYYSAFQLVEGTLRKIHSGAAIEDVIFEDLMDWRTAMFQPSVKAFGLPPSSLIGYRNGPVFIRDSMHVPPPKDSLLDAMEAFEDLFKRESHAFKRAVLAHHLHVYIHPFSDGNGRTARFLLNVSLVAGNLPWTVIPKETKAAYFSALEAAHAGQGITTFAEFIAAQMRRSAPR